MIILGMLRRCSRRPSVMPPRPMEVKKLMAKRVLRGLSRGISPCSIRTHTDAHRHKTQTHDTDTGTATDRNRQKATHVSPAQGTQHTHSRRHVREAPLPDTPGPSSRDTEGESTGLWSAVGLDCARRERRGGTSIPRRTAP
eukprot:273378-Rhodomonas_salina.1